MTELRCGSGVVSPKWLTLENIKADTDKGWELGFSALFECE